MNHNTDKNVFFNFHDKDIVIERKTDNISYCMERLSDKNQWTPFLSFPITKNAWFTNKTPLLLGL